LAVLVLLWSCWQEPAFANPIEAHFPTEGYDFVSGDLRAPILDNTLYREENVSFNGINLAQVPINVGNIQPLSLMEFETDSRLHLSMVELSRSYATDSSSLWSSTTWDYAQVLESLAKTRGLKVGKFSPLGLVGYSVGGSQRSSFQWAREKLQQSQSSIVQVRASYDFAHVSVERPWRLHLDQDFLVEFALLPTRNSWDEASLDDKRWYKLFFDTYGTHYVESAKFGGSYESVVATQTCDLVLRRATSVGLERCIQERTQFSFSEALPFVPSFGNDQASCRGFTSDGSYAGSWTYSSIQSREVWEGGCLDGAPNIVNGNFTKWIQDVQRNPRAVPTTIVSIPDMIRTIHNIYASTQQQSMPMGDDSDCVACFHLAEIGLDAPAVSARLDNLDRAFAEYLYADLESKLEQEDGECTLTCPTSASSSSCEEQEDSQKDALNGPSEQCTCPLPEFDSCRTKLETDDIMNVEISQINFRVRRIGSKRGVGAGWRKRLQMYTFGLGELDSGPIYLDKTRDEIRVEKSYEGVDQEFSVRIEVNVARKSGDCNSGLLGLRKKECPLFCVGSVEYKLADIGKARPLNGPCLLGTDKKHLEDAEISLGGKVSFPHCCNCRTIKSDGEDDLGGVTNVGMIFAILATVLVCCCCCVVAPIAMAS